MSFPRLLKSAARHRATLASARSHAESGLEAAIHSGSDRWSYRYPLRQRLAAAWKGHHPDSRAATPHAVEKAAVKLLRRPEKAAEVLANLPVEQRRSVALAWALTELEEEFVKADRDKDGKLTYAEFKTWAQEVINTGPKRVDVEEPTQRQLCAVAIATSVPFIGFGMVDNGLMVIFGDVLDSTMGMCLGCSMLASAALGNAISNVFGMLLHGSINKGADRLGLPDPRLTLSQRKLPVVHHWSTAGSTVGVFIGCLLGMTPLLFMDQTRKEEERACAKLH
mmetsp:Transcript_131101/g.327083  ORF Transcript_131101/g.327083 Transcript_131101/m.327083 type:complete len:280 (+) Transcript_131101:67-906(+)